VALFCPMLDDRTAACRELDSLAHRIWDNRNNRAAWSAYLSQAPGSPATPPYAVAARREDLRGLAPTWLAVSDIDLLFEEGKRYHARLRESGVDARLYVIPQAPHGFETMLLRTRLARELFRAHRDFLRERLHL
jgi:acetyl esterase/lipase